MSMPAYVLANALQDIVGCSSPTTNLLVSFISDGIGGIASTIFSPGLPHTRTIAAAGTTRRVCVRADEQVGCFEVAANGTATLINTLSIGGGATTQSQALTVSASGAWLLLPIITQSSIATYSMDPNSGALSFASQASVAGTPRGVLFCPDNQHLVVALSDSNTVSVRRFDPATGALPFIPQPVSYPAGDSPQLVAVDEFSAGFGYTFGYAVTSSIADTVSLLPGNETGPTGPATSFPVACTPSAIVTSDLDLDGDTDMVIGCADSSPLTVLLNDGQGGL
jgi:Lactonase, 7-bladed beta-propeller